VLIGASRDFGVSIAVSPAIATTEPPVIILQGPASASQVSREIE